MSNKSFKRRSFWVGLYVFAALFIGLGFVQAQACVVVQEPCDGCDPPEWWDAADAQIVFNPIPNIGTGNTSRADRPGYPWEEWFQYTWNTYSSFDGNDFIVVNLDNEQHSEMTKLFWVAFEFTGQLSSTDPLVSITGYYDQPGFDPIAPIAIPLFSKDFTVGNGCAWIETSMYPQPARETFLIALGGPDYDFEVDCLTLGVKAVPIPSTVLLLGVGFAGLIGFRKRRAKKS